MPDASPRPPRLHDHHWRALLWSTLSAVLLLPAVAMQFTEEVQWDGADFAVAAVLLGSVGAGVDATLRRWRHPRQRAAMALACVTALMLVWACLAVGFFGPDGAPADLLQGLVLGVALVGGLLARGRAAGMSRVLALTALAQVAVSVVAALAGAPVPWGPTLGFAALWWASSRLFAQAARTGA